MEMRRLDFYRLWYLLTRETIMTAERLPRDGLVPLSSTYTHYYPQGEDRSDIRCLEHARHGIVLYWLALPSHNDSNVA